jgi:putative addiction module component (TIGR02574 family)
MTTVALKNRVLEFVETADNKLLKMIYALAESYQQEETELTVSQKNEIDRRLERFAEGKTHFFTREEVQDKLRKA